ncbi:restriction endonuclease [Commensalibacter oyaizuii]|uniref:Restriction endonuclease n=1 Tax=Commensalibacter oyaizuii TaxID=3043873 RepID=A0ABT6Q593_9PROT|nr:restriction endonuclease [Commensalibacter sp. TBRC 16381]MDI2091649.1 restriction endonuclease [Commensalibacter sp. TBRC 16381]
MKNNYKFWGIHMGIHVGSEPIEKNYVAIGWQLMGDLRLIENNRDDFKFKLKEIEPNSSDASIRSQIGSVYRFVHEIKIGDYIIYPCKADRLIYIGQITSDYYYDNNKQNDNDDHELYPNKRAVKWLMNNGIPRSQFPQNILNTIGSFMTLFEIKDEAALYFSELLSTNCNNLSKQILPSPQDYTETSIDENEDEEIIKDTVNITQQSTEDFIIKRLYKKLSPTEFEFFIAHLLECMGYVARVTQQSRDGGVDIIVHKDQLGFEPPIIKVQCKHTTDKSTLPQINQLLGTLSQNEYALFVNLGSYTSDAKQKALNESRLRLIDGQEIVKLIYNFYDSFLPKYRVIIPLKQVFIPNLPENENL